MLKLGRIPDRTPVKLTILIPPELNEALKDYAAAYQEAYGPSEPVAELVPAMLASFIETDRAFMRARQPRGQGGAKGERGSRLRRWHLSPSGFPARRPCSGSADRLCTCSSRPRRSKRLRSVERRLCQWRASRRSSRRAGHLRHDRGGTS